MSTAAEIIRIKLLEIRQDSMHLENEAIRDAHKKHWPVEVMTKLCDRIVAVITYTPHGKRAQMEFNIPRDKLRQLVANNLGDHRLIQVSFISGDYVDDIVLNWQDNDAVMSAIVDITTRRHIST